MYRASSSARPFWFALFQECFDPFAEIVALADASVFADGGLDLRGEFASTVEQLLRRNDFVDQAHLQGFRRVEDTARQQEVASDFLADLPQQKSRDDGRHESDPDLGIAKLGFRHRKGEIA